MRFQFNPFTEKLDITGQGPTGNPVETLTGNDMVPVTADASLNIGIVGENVLGINVTGNALTHILTIAGINATTTQKGVLATATNAEAAAQSSTTKALTPSNITSLFSTSPVPVNQGGTGQTSYTDGQLLIGNSTGNTLSKNSLTAGAGIVITPGSGTITIAANGVPAPNQLQIYYVGKNGNDANTGLNIENSKLTFGAAITAASALIPSASNRFVISCIDEGIYAENITCVAFVDINAPNASLTGTITCVDNSDVKFHILNVATATTGITKSAGSTITNVDIDIINCVGSGNALQIASGELQFKWKELTIVDGTAITDTTSSTGELHLLGGDIYISGNGTAISKSNTDKIVGHVDQILDTGAGVTSALVATNGTFDINVNNINCDAAYNIDGATTFLNLFCNELTGTRTSTTSSVAKVSIPPVYGSAGQILQSSGQGVDPAYTTATYPATTAQGDLLLSSALNTITALNKNTNATRYLANTGVNNNAKWDQVNVGDGVTGTLLPANGGTGLSSPAAHSLIVTNGSSAYTALGVATNGQIPIGSTGADPVLALPTNGSNISWTGGAGTLTANLTGTTNHNIQIGNAGGSLTSLGSATNGQIPIGSTNADPVLATLTSANSSITVTNGAGSIDLSGKVVQQIRAQTAASITTATQIPADNTIPQNTEGAEMLTVSITPKNASNVLVIEANVWGSVNAVANFSIAVFVDTTADAIGATTCVISASQYQEACVLKFSLSAGSTSARTYKLRFGPNTATGSINGPTTNTYFNGVGYSYLQVTEYTS